MPSIKVKRGTKTQIDAAAALNQLAEGEPYLMTDQQRFAIGIAANSYQPLPTMAEVDALAANQDWGLIDGSLTSYDDFGGLD